MVVEGDCLAEVAIAMGVDVDDAGGCLLETALSPAALVPHNDLIIQLQLLYVLLSQTKPIA